MGKMEFLFEALGRGSKSIRYKSLTNGHPSANQNSNQLRETETKRGKICASESPLSVLVQGPGQTRIKDLGYPIDDNRHQSISINRLILVIDDQSMAKIRVVIDWYHLPVTIDRYIDIDWRRLVASRLTESAHKYHLSF